MTERLGAAEFPFHFSADWSLVREGGGERLSLDRFIRQLRGRLDADESVGELLTWIVSDYVIKQHQRVALDKIPMDTFRFKRASGGELWFTGLEARARMSSSRFGSLSTAVDELGLVEAMATRPALTADGRRILAGFV